MSYISGLVSIIILYVICPAFLLCFYFFLVLFGGVKIKIFILEVMYSISILLVVTFEILSCMVNKV